MTLRHDTRKDSEMQRFVRALEDFHSPASWGPRDTTAKKRAALIQRVRRMCDHARQQGMRETWERARVIAREIAR